MANIGFSEDDQNEFKEAWSNSVPETLAAFANHRGGTVFIGVRKDSEVLGTDVSDDAQRQAADRVVHKLGLTCSIQAVEYVGQPVLRIGIEPSPAIVACGGHYFKRVGSTNRDLSPEELAQLMLQRVGRTWDTLPSPYGIEAVDEGALRSFLDRARPRMTGLQDGDSSARILENLRLLVDGKLTNAGLLLLSTRPQGTYPAAQIHIARFVSNDEYANDQIIGGTLFQQLDSTMAYFRQNLSITERVELSDEPGLAGIQRQEIWPYPRPALREMVVNALMHRDYATPGNIQIKVWNDHVLCWNPGELVPGLSIADIQQPGHVSRPRNPLIAQMFHLADLAEQWGTGTTRMIEECRDARLPDPSFGEEAAGLKVVFQSDLFSGEYLARLGLSSRQLLAVEHIRMYGEITNSEYIFVTQSSRATASRDLEDLVRREVFRREGSSRGRGVRYTLNRQ